MLCFFFFFSSRRRHTRWTGDWSSDVCSSDLSFRDRGAYHEAVTNEIVDHLDATLHARFLRLTARFNARGGICTTVVAERSEERRVGKEGRARWVGGE